MKVINLIGYKKKSEDSQEGKYDDERRDALYQKAILNGLEDDEIEEINKLVASQNREISNFVEEAMFLVKAVKENYIGRDY